MVQAVVNNHGIVASFSFKHDDLFERIKKISAQRIKLLIQDQDQFDAMSVSDDERDFFDDNYYNFTDAVYEYLTPYANKFSQGYVQVTNPTSALGVDMGNHTIYTLSFSNNFDINVLNNIDNKIENYIVCGLLASWFMFVNQPELSAIYTQEKESRGEEIKSLLMKRIFPIRRGVTHFC